MSSMNKPSFHTWFNDYTYIEDSTAVSRRDTIYEDFIVDLQKFLASNGLLIKASNSTMVYELARRAYNAAYSLNRQYARFHNTGDKTMDEFETYTDLLDSTTWNNFLKKWDDVEDFKKGKGHETILTIFPLFAWTYIDTSISPAYLQDWMNDMNMDDDEPQQKVPQKTNNVVDPYLLDQQELGWTMVRKH